MTPPCGMMPRCKRPVLSHINNIPRCFAVHPEGYIVHDGYRTNLGVTVLGEILEVASFVATPFGAILAVSVAAAAFFYGRWVLAD